TSSSQPRAIILPTTILAAAPTSPSGSGRARLPGRVAARDRIRDWVSDGVVIGASGRCGTRCARLLRTFARLTRPHWGHGPGSPPHRTGRPSRRVGASGGVFVFLEGAVGDLAQQTRVVLQRADMAPVDLVGVGLEMVVAEGLQALQHGVDLDLG